MKIDRVTVRYGELRSSGYPHFSNRRFEIELSASLDSGETANQVKIMLMDHARQAVNLEFCGEIPAAMNDMDIPF